ncbi:glycosyltransferase family 4 protein [Rheinheimera hassiensis]|uniref:glycosyltransferase family 4 protein n=1 Tax=Rheinheimera hassiensis TaxID=1193627 RepID=UPI001F053A10|nr:glycosyltransferase [Rheinheimera hassiensis]
MTYKTTFFSVHPIDPFGSKVGGIETHVRQLLKYCPADMRLILIGVDDSGKRKLGELTEVEMFGGRFLFMPILHCHQGEVNAAAKSLFQSTTLRFFVNFIRFSSRIKALAKEMPSSFDIQRYEFAWLCRLYGFDYVLTTHGDANPDQPMDSLLSRYWFLHKFNEKHAVQSARHVYSVNQQQTDRIRRDYPEVATKTDFMTVSVDDQLFKPTAYQNLEGPLKIAFVGRLDTFKRPGMMFNVIAEIAKQTNNQVEFHYVGAAKPQSFAEFAAIEPLSVCHGFKTSAQVAQLWQGWHMGIVTSVFEGMPVYVLEALCAGRPVCSVNLPQLSLVIDNTVNGVLLEQNNDSAELVQKLAQQMLATWHSMRSGQIQPEHVNQMVAPYKASNQMRVLFDKHAQLQSRSAGLVAQS